MTPLGVAARQYAAHGWPVFPLARRGKLPAIANPHPDGSAERASCRGECGLDGHGLYDATLDVDRVSRWWTDHPQANIGVRSGVTFDVLDIDGPEGDQALGDLARRLGVETITDGPMVETAHGWHLFFNPSGHGNRAGLLPKVDWRGRGGYVVGPPSTHPSGHLYRWLPGLGLDTPLEAVPAWLLDLLNRPSAPAWRPQTATASSGSGGAYGAAAVEREAGRVALAPEGQRNHQLNASAFSLGTLIGAGRLEPATAAAALLTAAERAGLSQQEAQATIASGMRNGIAKPRKAAA